MKRSRLEQITSVLFGRLGSALIVLGLASALSATTACMPPTPAQKASEAAREFNLATRWGKMDDAVTLTHPDSVTTFRADHALWHDEIRLVDTELAGMNMIDATHAVVQVDVSWNFDDDPTLRVTRITQKWSDAEGKWVLMEEEYLDGDPGLFGEEVEREDQKRDKHFPSRVIH